MTERQVKRIRHIRMPDSLWDAASERAAREDMTVSELIRVVLRDYLRD